MSFMSEMENVLNSRKTLTENGAIAYATSGKELLDFSFQTSALRNQTEENIKKLFAKAYYENELLAIKYIFYVGDIREGLGERKVFRACFDWLIENKPEKAIKLLFLIPEYNRWDSLSRLVKSKNKNIKNDVIYIIKNQLEHDMKNARNGKSVSLCAKWLQSENASSKETKLIASELIKGLGITPRQYRKTLAYLREKIDVVERKMSANEWGQIKYENVPSRANLIYSDAFLNKDKERRKEYLQSLVKGETKINAGVLNPHEIVGKYTRMKPWQNNVKDYDEALEQMWKALPDLTVENGLVVRDGSGSMTTVTCGDARALEVATALALYMSERNTGEWKNKFITFSSEPKLIDISNCETLRDKIVLCNKYADCGDTNLKRTLMLVLETAARSKLSQEEMPQSIVILSDMQFNPSRNYLNKSLMDSIALEFEKHDYKLPKIIFWNLNAKISKTIPMQQNELGLVLCSGFTPQLLKMFMSNETNPYKCLVEQLNSARYKVVENALK